MSCQRKADKNGRLAQLGEHLPYKQEVIGSSPIATTILWPGSSVGQNASLSRQRSTVRARSGSPETIQLSQIVLILFGSIAQLVEQRTENPRVSGSIPLRATTVIKVQSINDLKNFIDTLFFYIITLLSRLFVNSWG